MFAGTRRRVLNEFWARAGVVNKKMAEIIKSKQNYVLTRIYLASLHLPGISALNSTYIKVIYSVFRFIRKFHKKTCSAKIFLNEFYHDYDISLKPHCTAAFK